MPDLSQQMVPLANIVQNGGENNAVNKVWHESYGSTTTTQPKVCHY